MLLPLAYRHLLGISVAKAKVVRLPIETTRAPPVKRTKGGRSMWRKDTVRDIITPLP